MFRSSFVRARVCVCFLSCNIVLYHLYSLAAPFPVPANAGLRQRLHFPRLAQALCSLQPGFCVALQEAGWEEGQKGLYHGGCFVHLLL